MSQQAMARNGHISHRIWLISNMLWAACCGSIHLLMPYMNSFEDQASMMLGATAQRRGQIAFSTFATGLIIAPFPAAFSYGFSKLYGIDGGRSFKSNRALHMSVAVWAAQAMLGFIGAFAFWLGRTPFNLFGN